MKEHTANRGCKSSGTSEHQHKSLTCTIISGFSSYLKSVLGTTLPVLAAFACGCIKEHAGGPGEDSVVRTIELQMKGHEEEEAGHIERADIFVFNADSLGRLDAYQMVEDIDEGEISVCSTGGRKKIFICCNIGMDEEDMMRIGSVMDLEESFCMLENLSRGAPMMLGCIETEARQGGRVTLTPMTGTIVLRSVCSRFTGTSYEGEPITDAKVYLTNVNAQCNLSGSHQTARRFINMGMLNMEDVGRFNEPDLVVQEIDGVIGEEVRQTDISLMCFHNYCEDESPGSPFTRLVVEGKIRGETFYWPITINRTGNGKGIRDNTRHVIDLTIRRKGSSDPDEEIIIEDSEITMEIMQWEEKEGYSVGF